MPRTEVGPGPDGVVRADMDQVLQACAAELSALRGGTLLLTGAGGFVGSYLVESMLAWNATQSSPCRLLLPVRSPAAVWERYPHWQGAPGLQWLEWSEGRDLTVAGEPPADFVIHAAAPADPAVYLQDPYATLVVTARLTRQVLDYAVAAKVQRLLYISSGAVYGSQPVTLAAIPESYAGAPDLASPRSCYAEAKRYCELLCRTAPVASVIARLFCFLGPYQGLESSFAAPNFLLQSLRDRRIVLHTDGRALRTYYYASDLAASLWTLLIRGQSGEVYNVGGGPPAISILELAQLIARHTGEVPLTAPPPAAPPAPAPRYVPDTSRLEALYRPQVGLESGVMRTLASLRLRGLDYGPRSSS